MVKWQYASVDLSVDSTTVSATTVWFLGVIVTTTMSAHDCEIKDGTTVVLVIPSGSAIGTTYSLEGVVFSTSLVVDPHNDATGRITVIYKASA